MSIAAPLQGHFDGGEVSPLLYGRVDSERYKSSLALCRNWIPTLQGGLPRRPGTMYINTVKNSAFKVRLVPFKFSTTQAYMLEFGNVTSVPGESGYVRIYANYGIVGGGTPIELVVPYQAVDLPLLRFTQSADVIYIVHPKYPPATISRFSATNWAYTVLSFSDGPYQPINVSPYLVLFASATTGTAVTVTANFLTSPTSSVASISATNMVNNGNGLVRVTIAASYVGANVLKTGDWVTISGTVGTTEANSTWQVTVISPTTFDLTSGVFSSAPPTFVHAYVSGGTIVPAPFVSVFNSTTPIRLQSTSTALWGWGTITGVAIGGGASYSSATVNVGAPFGDTNVTVNWRLGEWTVNNYPGAVSFHQDRLAFTGAPNNPQRIDASNTSDYLNFAETLADGTVTDACALNFNLNAEDVNLNEWLVSDEKGLLSGSTSAEWLMWPSLQTGALTPTNVYAVRTTRWGSAPIQGILVGKCTLHVARGARKLRELQFSFYVNGYTSTDLTELAAHITGSGVIDMAYTAIPVVPIVWLLRNDGTLLGMTYDRDQTQLRTGWHQHVLGGQSDASGTQPIIEGIAAIPSPDGTRDDLWMVVQRWINGSVVRTIEYLTKIFEDIDLQQNAYHLDCGLTYNNPVSVTAITTGSATVTVTAPSHGFSTGDTVRFDNIYGVLEAAGQPSALNGLTFVITVVDANNFTLNSVNGTTFTPFVLPTDQTVTPQTRKLVTTLSGLSYLQGETVSIFADGCNQPPQVVSNTGTLTLTTPAAVVSVGYSYNSDGQLLRLEAGSRNGTSLGKTRRVHRIGLMVHRSQGLQIGKSFNNLDPVQFRTSGADIAGQAAALYTGIESHGADFDYDFDNEICFRVSSPQPCTLLAIMPMLETQDRA